MWESKSESWRTYICFVLAGAIFIACQVLSGGVLSSGGGAKQAEETSVDPADRSYREAVRIETAGQGGWVLSGTTRPTVNRQPTD
jgi:hypothetical protein